MDYVIALSPEEILRKKFTRDVKGYDAFEVDEFLDAIIKDYQAYAASLEAKEREISSLKEELGRMTMDLEELKGSLAKVREERRGLEVANASLQNRLGGIKPGDTPSAENLQILKRLRALEDFLYNHGYNPNEVASGYKK